MICVAFFSVSKRCLKLSVKPPALNLYMLDTFRWRCEGRLFQRTVPDYFLRLVLNKREREREKQGQRLVRKKKENDGSEREREKGQKKLEVIDLI